MTPELNKKCVDFLFLLQAIVKECQEHEWSYPILQTLAFESLICEFKTLVEEVGKEKT